jgi:lipopolysaccharide/colanic/teichoic acid biosynthesis glycosyltransferase
MQTVEERVVSKKKRYDKFKRYFDLIFSIFVLVLTSPIFLIVSFLIKITSKGPVFYKQKRLGKDGKIIEVYKFRTMVKDADRILEEMLNKNPDLKVEFDKYFKLKNDPRVTTIGKLLRKTSLDELPQFINVIRGEMSVVGPRPVIQEELEYYGKYKEKLLSVNPGITGLWQVSGRADLPYSERVKLDMKYIDNKSFGLDLQILLKTFRVIFTGHGAY